MTGGAKNSIQKLQFCYTRYKRWLPGWLRLDICLTLLLRHNLQAIYFPFLDQQEDNFLSCGRDKWAGKETFSGKQQAVAKIKVPGNIFIFQECQWVALIPEYFNKYYQEEETHFPVKSKDVKFEEFVFPEFQYIVLKRRKSFSSEILRCEI